MAMPAATQPENISVIIPLYNKREYVDQCIRSVLDQTFQGFEIIVIDDASTDGSEAEAAKFADPRITIVHRTSSGPGPGPARNLGIRSAKYPWCAFLDADDIWDPAYLERMTHAIGQLPPNIGFVFSGFQNLDGAGVLRLNKFSEGRLGGPAMVLDLPDFIRAWIQNHNSPNRTSATIIRRDVLTKIGGFPEEEKCKHGEDKDTWLRTIMTTRCAYIPFVGMTYLTDSTNKISESTWSNELPCMRRSLNIRPSRDDGKTVKRLLRRLYNDEVLSNAKEITRSGSLQLSILRGFYFVDDPIKFILILCMWLLPNSVVSFVRRLRRLCIEATKNS